MAVELGVMMKTVRVIAESQSSCVWGNEIQFTIV